MNDVAHPIELDYTPRPQMVQFHARSERFAVIVAHRRFGKTVASVRDLEKAILASDLPNPRGAYVCPLFRQAKDVAFQYLCETAYPLLEFGAKINKSDLSITYPNGGQVKLYGVDSRPDAMRGLYFDYVVLDEYADMDPDLWPSIIRPTLADRRGRATFISTPKGRNLFHELWLNALKDPEWFTLMLKASETGVLPEEELASAKRYMSKHQYAREFECSFDTPDVDILIDQRDVDAAIERSSPALGPKVLGVDVARFGDDRTVIVMRNGDRLEWVDVAQGQDLIETTNAVVRANQRFKPRAIFVDENGLGAGVVDGLRQLQLGVEVIGVNSSRRAAANQRFANLRAEMYWRLRDWIRDRADLPDHAELKHDLTAVTYKYDHRNCVLLESKDAMKQRGIASPDIGDALALTFAQPLGIFDVEVLEKINAQREWHVPDYDPFDYLGGSDVIN